MGRRRTYITGRTVNVTAQQAQAITRHQAEVGGTWSDAVRYGLDLLCREQQQADELREYFAALDKIESGNLSYEERQAVVTGLTAMRLPGERLSLYERLKLLKRQGILSNSDWETHQSTRNCSRD